MRTGTTVKSTCAISRSAAAWLVVAGAALLSGCSTSAQSSSPSNSPSQPPTAEQATLSIEWASDAELQVPRVTGGGENLDAVNSGLAKAANRWVCKKGGDSAFKIEEASVTGGYASVHFSAMQMCDSMPRPATSEGGLLLRLDDGSKANLSDFAPCLQEDEIEALVMAKASQTEHPEHCPAPRMPSSFFLRGESLVFVEFFLDHYDSPCEFELEIERAEFGCP